MSFRLGTRERQEGPRGWRTSCALQPGGLFLAVTAVSTTVLKSEGQGEGGGRERGAQQAEGEHGHTTQPTAALWQGWARSPRPQPVCGRATWRQRAGGDPQTAENSPADLEVQPLADRLVSTQLASSEAVRKLGSGDCSHPGTQLSASTDAQPRPGLSWPRKQLKPFLLKWEPEHGAMPNPSQFLNPSVCLGHPERSEGNFPQPPGSRTPSSGSAGATLAQAEGKASPTKAARAEMRD